MGILKEYVDKIPKEERRLYQKMGDVAFQVGKILYNNKWSQKQLAERLGCKESYISRILGGEANITLGTIARLEIALGEEILVAPTLYEKEQQVQKVSSKSEFSYTPEDTTPTFLIITDRQHGGQFSALTGESFHVNPDNYVPVAIYSS